MHFFKYRNRTDEHDFRCQVWASTVVLESMTIADIYNLYKALRYRFSRCGPKENPLIELLARQISRFWGMRNGELWIGNKE